MRRVRRAWSREPQLTPMRTGLSLRTATSIMARKLSSSLRPMEQLPGLMRYLARARAQSGGWRWGRGGVVGGEGFAILTVLRGWGGGGGEGGGWGMALSGGGRGGAGRVSFMGTLRGRKEER